MSDLNRLFETPPEYLPEEPTRTDALQPTKEAASPASQQTAPSRTEPQASPQTPQKRPEEPQRSQQPHPGPTTQWEHQQQWPQAHRPGPAQPQPQQPEQTPPPVPAPAPRRHEVSELISQLQRPPEVPATGWRKLLRLGPSKAAEELAADQRLLRTGFVRPIVIMVANPKGGVGKALSVHEPVLTPQGYRPIGDLAVGDLVIGRDGLSYDVLGVFPQGERDLFEVTFSDGTTVLADGDHLWEVQTNADRNERRGSCIADCDRPVLAKGLCSGHYDQQRRGKPMTPLRKGNYARTVGETRIVSTTTMIEHGVTAVRPDGSVRHNFFVAASEPIKTDSTATTLDPYLLGLLLGDGGFTDGTPMFSTPDAELVDAVARTVPSGVTVQHKSTYDHRIVTTEGRRNALTDMLRDLGLWGLGSPAKFVPEAYRMGDLDTRVAVLQGLMDTDGTVEGGGAAASFTTTSSQLAEDVKFIAESVGCVVRHRTRTTHYTHNGERRTGRLSHTLYISPPASVELFRLERQRTRMKPVERHPFRAITSITPAGRGEAVCISVASPDHLFLTRNCVPTHNTPTSIGLSAAFGDARGGGVVGWDNNELRGTMGDRTFAEHQMDVVDMLTHRDALLQAQTRAADVHRGLHYQSNGQFWVLRSSQVAGHQITDVDFNTVREILSRFFPVIIIDTGNNEVASNWLATAEHADALIVPLAWRKDNLIPAARMLKTLSDEKHDIVNRTIVVGTNGPNDAVADVRSVAHQWFDGYPILEVPTDPHIAEGAEIDWAKLNRGTRRAYQRLGAVTASVIADYLNGEPSHH